MQDGIKYLGRCGNPAQNDDGTWWADEVRPIGTGPGEVSPERAAIYIESTHFEAVTIGEPEPEPEEPVAPGTSVETPEAPQGEPPPPSGVRMQLVITNAMRKQLRAKGFDDAAIDKMTPEEAAAALA